MQVEACIYFTRAALQSPNKCTIIIMLLLGFEFASAENREDYIMESMDYKRYIIKLIDQIHNQTSLKRILDLILYLISKE